MSDEWAALEEVARAATPGPYRVVLPEVNIPGDTGPGYTFQVWSGSHQFPGRLVASVMAMWYGRYEGPKKQAELDSAFIAAADPQTVLRLIEQKRVRDRLIEQLRDAVASLEEGLRQRTADQREAEARAERLAGAIRWWLQEHERLEQAAFDCPFPDPKPLRAALEEQG